jgi:hypothetical protein
MHDRNWAESEAHSELALLCSAVILAAISLVAAALTVA